MKSKILIVALFLAAIALFSGCSSGNDAENKSQKQDTGYIDNMLNIKKESQQKVDDAVQKENNKINEAMNEEINYTEKYNAAEIETNFGKIKVKFYNTDSPVTVNNFMKLSSQKFYNSTKFHRVIKDFMIQGGDPNSKDDDWSNDGTGGPGYKFKDEINSHKLVKGSLAMANSGPNTNGSQFFIVTAEAASWLDGKHTNFGEVALGMNVVDKIQNVAKNEKDHPTQDVIIKSITLLNEK
jgi:cyclophilin family peptidyl-prolyl cis-trans isomerase